MLSERDWPDEHVEVENEILAKMGGRNNKFKKEEPEKDGGEKNDKGTSKTSEVKSPGSSSQGKKTSDSSTSSSDSGTCKTEHVNYQ
jgi:hypothetical protein